MNEHRGRFFSGTTSNIDSEDVSIYADDVVAFAHDQCKCICCSSECQTHCILWCTQTLAGVISKGRILRMGPRDDSDEATVRISEEEEEIKI